VIKEGKNGRQKVVWTVDRGARVYELGIVLGLSSPTVLGWLNHYGVKGKRSASSKVSLTEAFYFLDCMAGCEEVRFFGDMYRVQ
jgi:hypothetical protein